MAVYGTRGGNFRDEGSGVKGIFIFWGFGGLVFFQEFFISENSHSVSIFGNLGGAWEFCYIIAFASLIYRGYLERDLGSNS